MPVGICSNATTLTDQHVTELSMTGDVHVSVSLDGFRPESHGKFRGDRASFAVTVNTIRKLAAAGLLQGLLCTPKSLAEDAEYRELCEFAVEHGAGYVVCIEVAVLNTGQLTWQGVKELAAYRGLITPGSDSRGMRRRSWSAVAIGRGGGTDHADGLT